jgi:hypothetical protein
MKKELIKKQSKAIQKQWQDGNIIFKLNAEFL